MKYLTSTLKILFFIIIFSIGFIPEAQAHVKWFTDGSYADRPLKAAEVIEGSFFYLLFVLCLLIVVFGVWVDTRIFNSRWYKRLDNWLETRKAYSGIILRVAAAMVLLLSWQSDAMIVPPLRLGEEYQWIGWLQFILAFLLLFPKTIPIGGIGIVFIWILGNFLFHPFHMLDYLMFAGCGIYLTLTYIANAKYKDIGLVILYITVGFSLCWVALEKFIYPNWSLFLVEEHPNLAMGLNPDLFIKAVAFIEFALGYLLLICLLQRPLALIITAIFFLTTLIFGKIEVIGHTMIHGALMVFLLEGAGSIYKRFRQKFGNVYKRMSFTAINFILLFGVLLFTYNLLAGNKYQKKQEFLSKKPEHLHGEIELAGYPKSELPNVWMEIIEDPMGGYNIKLNTINFTFTPEKVNAEHVLGEGHAHLYINGQKVARVYSDWYYMPALEPGNYEISVTLNSNDHNEYCIRGTPIQANEMLTVTENNTDKE